MLYSLTVARMLIGLTGGVGSGKSTVARRLAEHGAVIVDADVVAREVVAPGTPGLAAVVARFGDDVLAGDGTLDRPVVARLVFGDESARADLNAIVHPLVRRRTAELVAAAGPDRIVVNDVPLLVETGLADGFDSVLVVEAPLALRLSRLAERGLPEAQARARIAAQADDEQRRAVADEIVVNDGDLDVLRERVDAAWRRITRADDDD